jgi:hypothetical protein
MLQLIGDSNDNFRGIVSPIGSIHVHFKLSEKQFVIVNVASNDCRLSQICDLKEDVEIKIRVACVLEVDCHTITTQCVWEMNRKKMKIQ